MADALYNGLRLRLLAVSHLPLIVSDEPETLATWYWIRRVVATHPPSRDERDGFINAACGFALQMWGVAIEAQSRSWPADGSRPPRLQVRRGALDGR